jgi:hypothetical protein
MFMFDMLISCKKKVAIRCGPNDITGVITNFYEPFRLLKINNILLPIEHIESITVLDGNTPPPYSSRCTGSTLRQLL